MREASEAHSVDTCLMPPDLEKEWRQYIHHDFLSQSRRQEPISLSVNSRPLQTDLCSKLQFLEAMFQSMY